ncbi:MAG: hypothetical protein JSV54_04480 [Chloroflexota bacterium]|nr:MAG: hypothetical protein JSV54_04480 [Chloroflexota bacterium]
MRLIKGLIMVIGIIGILVTGTLLIGYYLYSLSPPIQSKMIPILPSPDAAQSFDQKINSAKDEIDAAVNAGQTKEITLTITDKEVNSKLIEIRAAGELPARDASINFGNDQFLAYAVVDTPGINAKTAMIGQVEIVNGYPKIVIEDFNLGKLPLPESADRRVEQLLNVLVRLQLGDMPLEITDIQINNHELTVTGTTKTGK